MSRIIVTRHPNGEERLVLGWDRPLNSAFVDLYNDEADVMETRGPMAGETLTVTDALVAVGELALNGYGTGLDLARPEIAPARISALLEDHRALDYPASNIVVDLTQEG